MEAIRGKPHARGTFPRCASCPGRATVEAAWKEAAVKRILIATDGSPLAQEAVEIGLELAEEQGAEVMFIHVLGPEDRFGGLPSDDRAVLSAAAVLAEEKGVRCKLELCSGAPAERILHAADEFDADVIVVGSRGMGPWRSALLGSVSREVMSKARRPVLIVRGVRERVEVGG
jgi:nucleotide-binding universal stress UspA family protein